MSRIDDTLRFNQTAVNLRRSRPDNSDEEELKAKSDKPVTPKDGPGTPAESKKDNPAEAKAKPPEPAPAKVKPAFERGRPFDLFPPDRESVLADYISPAADNHNKPSGLKMTKYDGWTWMSNKMTGFSIKSGVLSMEGGSFSLDGFPAKEFVLNCEVDLSANSALGIQFGATNEFINLLAVYPTHIATGTWEAAKAADNIKINGKEAKPHGIKAAWIPVQLIVRAGLVEMLCNSKSIFKGPPPGANQFSRLGFMALGQNGNANPNVKLRKVIVTAP